MINLLPPESKRSLIFAHHNTKLSRVIIGLSIGILGTILVVLGCLFYMQQESNYYKQSVKEAEASLKKQNETATIARVEDISNSLKLVVDVLSQEILFSKLLRQVGAQMPPNTVLQNLKLSNELTGALDLEVGAVDYNAASQVQVNILDSEDSIFDKADLVNVTCGTDNDSTSYPCKAVLRAVFSKDNDFMLLNKKRPGDTR